MFSIQHTTLKRRRLTFKPQKLPEGQKILLPRQELINSSEINTIGGTLIENTTTESTITAIEADTTSEDEIVWAAQNERIAFVPK